MDNFDKNFGNVFDGIHKTMDAIDHQLDVLQAINKEQKNELQKAKRFNIAMAIIAVISLAISVASLIITLR